MEDPNIELLFLYLGRIVVMITAIPIIIAIKQRKNWNKPIRIFFYYVVALFAINMVEQFIIWYVMNFYDSVKDLMEKLNIYNTNFLLIFYRLANVIFLAWFFYLLLPKKYNYWIKTISILLSIVLIISYLFVEGHESYGIFSPNATYIFTFAISFFYLRYLYKVQLNLLLKKNPYFWFSFAMISIYLTSFFLSLFGGITYEENYLLFIVLSLTKNIFLVIGQFFISLGFWHAPYAKYITPSA